MSGFPSMLKRTSTYGSKIQKPNGSTGGDDADVYAQTLKQFREKCKERTPIFDLGALSGIVDAIRHTNAMDDRKMLLEHVLTFISHLPPGPKTTDLENATVELLYKDLPHPPSSYVGNKYAWRTADGSGNNLSDPELGKAHTPYSRSVQQITALPVAGLPDPGLIFDTLLRREKFVPHPAGLSSMMFSFAALVIHTVFRTSHYNPEINETSSYVDLAPLYGHDQKAQDKVRTRNGRGTLHPDAFAEDRLLLLPPAVCVLLVLFNRNHNYIAQKLLELNERGTYADPDTIPASDPKRASKLLAQEEDIFQTARLINCGWFGSCVFSDYFSAILGLVRQGNSWSLNPFGEIRDSDHSLFERGRGNVCSVEFNCLYRWHPTTSQHDEKWVEQLSSQLFHDKPIEQVTPEDMYSAIIEMKKLEPDCEHWTFGGMTRQDNGNFKDDQLAAIIQEATANPAGAFKARGTPHIMRLHEIMGIQASRKWGCCSLNDFREFLGLKRYATFSEWNSDPEVSRAAEKLYGNIDRLELYTGLQAEEAKPVMNGAGLCPPYTISRAILSDAIALTRGDRFFTSDYTPHNLTAWGFADCQRDPSAPGYGSMLGRLLLRTLPEQFKADSTYAWFPLMTPEAMNIVLQTLGDDKKYDAGKPVPEEKRVEVSTYEEVAKILGDSKLFGPGVKRVEKVVKGNGFYIASEDADRAEREGRAMIKALVGAPGALNKLTKYFHDKTRALIAEETWTTVGAATKNVDIVRDVLKFVPIHWAAEVAGIKLKLGDSDDGVYTAPELYNILADIYEFLFLDFESWKYLPLSEKTKSHVDTLLSHIKSSYGRTRLSIATVVNSVSRFLNGNSNKSIQEDLAARLYALGYDSDTLANSVLAVLVGASVELSQAMINVVNTYLNDSLASHVSPLCRNSKLNEQEQGVLEGCVLEALRLDPTFSAVLRTAKTPEVGIYQTYPAGKDVILNIAAANTNADVFPDPLTINPNRTPRSRYLTGSVLSRTLGDDLSIKIIAEVLRATYSHPNLRRAPGQSGVLNRYKTSVSKTSSWMYLDAEQKLCPWATSMVVQFD